MKSHHPKIRGAVSTDVKQKSKILAVAAAALATAWAASAQSLTWDPALNGGGGGTGTWNLNTTANWFNGTSDVKWTDNSALGTNGAIFGGTAGTVTLNSSLSASNLQFLASGYTLSGSGTLTLGAGGMDASTLSSGTTTVGNALSLSLGQQAWQVGAGATLAVNGTVTRATGASVDFAVPGITSTSLHNDATGILGAWATTGNDLVGSTTTGDWAANDGSGNIITYTNYTVVSSISNSSPDLTGAATQNWISGDPTGAGNFISTITNSVTLNTLVMQGDVIVPNNITLTLGGGGLILRGISRWLIDQSAFTVGSAVIESGLPSGEFFVHTPNSNIANNGANGGNWRIWPQIKDNGATPLILIKDGPGFVGLQNTNTYSGGTIINNGILAAGGVDTTTALAPVTLGSGTVTVNPHGVMEIGYGTANATLDYLYTNNVVLSGGKILADDGHNHVTGALNVAAAGGTLGSTYDGGGSGTTGNKALFIDGIVSGSGPLTLQQAVDAGDNDRYGNGGGNPYNSSVVEFSNNGNTYSGAITVVPYSTGSGAGSYVAINASSALQFATLNLDNNPGGHRYAGVNGIFSQLVFNTGLGSATVAAISGPGNIILNGFNENTYAVNPDPIALTVGNGVNTTISGIIAGSGSLIKVGSSTLTLSGANTYTGDTVLSNGSIALTGAWLSSSNVVITTGRTLDASALGTATMIANQSLKSDGTLNGSLSAVFGSAIYGGNDGTYGTNAITGSLTMGSGAVAYFDVGALVSGPNDKVTVGGTLTANNNSIHLKAPSTSGNLDSSGDYVLFSSANNIVGTFATTPIWDVAPANANHYSIVTGTKTVTLHYSAVGGPGGVGSTTPFPVLRNQSVLITVNAVNGTVGTVNSVVVDASAIGGSATLALVNSGGNVWTNSVTVPFDLPTGLKNLVATVSQTDSLTAIVNISASVVAGNDVWNGGGADNNLSTALNWTNQLAPALFGDSLQFAGSTRLTPNVDNNFIVTGILFTTNAGAFNIGSTANTLTLTNGNGVVNNSTNIQTISAPIALAATPTFNAASNDIVLSGTVLDSASPGGLIKTGKHALTISGTDGYSGTTTVSGGTLNVTGSIGLTANTSSTFIGSAAGNSVLNIADPASLSAYYLLLGNVTNGVGALYQTGGTINANANSGFDNLSVGNVAGGYGYYAANGGTFNVNGICIGGEVNLGSGANFSAPGGNGIMEINGGTVQNVGWLVIARQNGGSVIGSSTGILNVFNGSLTYAGGGIVGPWDTGESAIINMMGGSVTSPNQGVRLGNTNFPGILNLDGGLLEVSEVSGYNGPTYAVVDYGYVNFNGGTLQASGTTTNFIHVTTANVYSGGAVIDNNGQSITIAQPLLAPSGNGVHGIASFTPGAGYIAPPIITIVNGTGDTTGSGATAIAQINPATGTLTNVIITCPGVNYTATPTFVLSGGGATTRATITGTAPTANTSGGLTSVGTGILTLINPNTYTGSTVVGAGTLELVNPVLAPASSLVVSNGAMLQLDFAGTNTISALTLNGVSEPQGVYNTTTSPTFITGTGSLVVGPATASNPTNITFSAFSPGVGGGHMTLSWPVDHLGWILQQKTNLLIGNWVDVPGTAVITSTNMPVNSAMPGDFFRLRHP